MKQKTIAVDFDGVLHAYSEGWKDGRIYDGPKPGAREGMQALINAGYRVIVFTTRAYPRVINGETQPSQIHEVICWLFNHGIPYHRVWDEPGKPLCSLFIDDRGFRFSDWKSDLGPILNILQND